MSHQNTANRAQRTLVDIADPNPEVVDLTPSDSQPPGVDEDDLPQSLEEALLGEQQDWEHLRVGPPFHWLLPSKEDTISRLDGGRDHKI